MDLIAMSCARTKPRMMPVRQRAIGIAGSQFLDQPLFLRRTPIVGIGIAVERKNMPGTELIAVIATASWSCVGAKIFEVRRRLIGVVIMIPR